MRKVPTGSFRFLGGSQSAPRCILIRSQTLGLQLGMYAVKLLLERNWEMSIFACSYADPGYIAVGGEMFLHPFLFAIILCDL